MDTAQITTEHGYQVIRLPEEFHLEGDAVTVKRVGRSLLLIPRDSAGWDLLTASLSHFTDDFMQDRAQPANQVRQPLSE